jgi:hypothetical protein
MLVGWKCFKENSLRNGLKGASSQALEDPEQDETLEIPCGTTQERTDGEQRNGEKEIVFSSEEFTQPPGHGNDDCVRNEIGGDGPRRFINSCGQATTDMIERDIDNRCVNNLNKGREHDRDGDNPLVHPCPGFPKVDAGEQISFGNLIM